ncbi:MAG TPA: sialidase family protein [Actinomycetota bacterium]|nr:sialidase family protein [Actinomycetota bacterium]
MTSRLSRSGIVAAIVVLVLVMGLTAWSRTTWDPAITREPVAEMPPMFGRTHPQHRGVTPDPTGQLGSGPRAVAYHSGGPVLRSRTLGAPDARLFRTGFSSWEPTMGVTGSGNVYFNATSDGGGGLIVRSTDGGKTWKAVFDGHSFTADPYMFVDDRTDRIVANDYVPPCHLVSFSDDEGKSWTTSPPAGCSYNNDHQTLFAGPAPKDGDQPQQYPDIVYLCSISGGISASSTTSACSKSMDGGVTFVPTGEPAYYDDPTQSGDYDVPGLCNGLNAHGFVGDDGTVYLPRGWCGQPWLAISHDEGLTWSRVQVSDLGMPCCGALDGENDSALFSHESAVVADRNGNVYYAWVAADRLPYLVASRDGGKTWGKPVAIGPPGLKEALLPGMAIGPEGGIVVRYLGSENSPWNGTEATGGWDKEEWNAYLTVATDPLASDPVLYTTTVNDPNDPLWVGRCGPDPIRCGWGDFQDVVVDRHGHVWSVDVDLCAGTKGCEKSETIIGHLVGVKL